MRFSDIPGLTETKQRLIRSVKSGKVAHAQLFMGREGALNLPLAIAYMTFLHCTNRGDTDACGQCPACSKNLKYIHPDTHFVFPVSNVKGDKDDDRFRADMLKSWRTFLLELPFGHAGDWTSLYGGEDKTAIISKDESREIVKALSLKPFESPFKVMIIWQPEAMHPSAANGILKILEEPPPQTFFLLVSHNAERLLPTILSRTQHVVVPLLDPADLDSFLLSREPDKERRAGVVADAEGNLRLALELLEEEPEDRLTRLAEWFRACYKGDAVKMHLFSEEFHEMDKLQQHALLAYAMKMFRETLLVHGGAETLLRSRGNEQEFARKFGRTIPLAAISQGYEAVNEAAAMLERNGSAKMIFMDTSLRLARAMGAGNR
jgi:DNA polymerase-3 subunit delta'